MSHRVNILLQDDTWEAFQSIPKDKRSKVVNALLRDWTSRQKRRRTSKEIGVITRTMKLLPNSAEEWIRCDRDQR
jgi:hypothetical protein